MFRSKARGAESSVELWEDLSTELWQVKDAYGRLTTMTIDELDAAYKRDDVTTRTQVRKVGTFKWLTLATVAGIEPSAPLLESESLMPVTSEIDVTSPRIPGPPAVPRIVGGAYEALPSSDLLDEGDDEDTLRPPRFAGAAGEKDGATEPHTVGLSGNQRGAAARRVFGLAALAIMVLGALASVTVSLSRSRTRGRADDAAAAMVAPPPPATPEVVDPPTAPVTTLIEGSMLVLTQTEPTVVVRPPPPVPARAGTVGRRPTVTSAPAKPSAHFALKAEPKKVLATNISVQRASKTKTR